MDTVWPVADRRHDPERWCPPAWDPGTGRAAQGGPRSPDARGQGNERFERWRPAAWDEGVAGVASRSDVQSRSVKSSDAQGRPLSRTGAARDPTHGAGRGDGPRDEGAQWGEEARSEPRWPASLAVLVAMAFYVALPDRVHGGLGPRWLVPALEGALGLALLIADPRIKRRSVPLRTAAIVLIALINLVNVVSLGELVNALLYGSNTGGRALVFSSIPIWLTNVIVYALWFWELDRGGPAARLAPERRRPDFLFPQMASPHSTDPDWSPSFHDYLYTSFTNATAFSPTDTMPLTAWAKGLMLLESVTSLLLVVLVVSRAVNILR